MPSSGDIVRGLRRDVAAAICDAQDIIAPRSRIELMCCSLLWQALAALDPQSGWPTLHAIRIASQALAEWRKRDPSNVLRFTGGR